MPSEYRHLHLDTVQIETSAAKITQELQGNVTQLQTSVNALVAAASGSCGLPEHLNPPPRIVIEDYIEVAPLLLINFRQTYIDALDEWTSHMRDALQTYELVVKGLSQSTQAQVALDQRDVIALPPGTTPA